MTENRTYWQAALNGEIDKLRSAPVGGRNNQLLRSASALRDLVAGGHGSRSEANEGLKQAAIDIGLDPRAIQATLNSAWRYQANARGPAPKQSPPGRRPDPKPSRPPELEVQALWRASRPLWSSQEPAAPEQSVLGQAQRFCLSRGWRPQDVALLDIARSTPSPQAHQYPAWWPESRARTWNIIVPSYTSNGHMASLHARAIADAGEEAPKTLWPTGYDSRDLLFADPHGLALLRRGQRMMQPIAEVLICEGITDYISGSIWARSREGARGHSVAVLGACSGGWGALAGIIWPDDVIIYAAVDQDAAGDRYYEAIKIALPLRVDLRRLNLGEDDSGRRRDLSDAYLAGTLDIAVDGAEPDYSGPAADEDINILHEYDGVYVYTLTSSMPKPPEWIIDGVIGKGKRIIIGAQEKTGKTYLTFAIGLSICTGQPLLGQYDVVHQGRVLYYSPETSSAMAKWRIFRLCWGLGINPDAVLTHLRFLGGRPIDVLNDSDLGRLQRSIDDNEPALLIVDPLVCAYGEADENSAEFKKVMEQFRILQQANGDMSLLLAHHSSKGGRHSQGYDMLRGSSVIGGSVDGLITVRRASDDAGAPRRVDFNLRDGLPTPPAGFTMLDTVMDGRVGPDGQPGITLDACEPPGINGSGRGHSQSDEKRERQDKIMSILHDRPGMTCIELANELGVSEKTIRRDMREIDLRKGGSRTGQDTP